MFEFSSENKVQHFMPIVSSLENNLHEMSNPVLLEN